MSLRNLLPISRSFAPSEDRAGRYRPADAGVVPDFSVPSRVTAAAAAAAMATATVPETVAVAGSARLEGVVGETRVSGGGARLGVRDSVGGAAGRVLVTRERRGGASGRRLPSWLEHFLASLIRPGNRRRGTRPVQTEMSFDRVRVARNDLTTSDVEVVLVRPARAASGMSAACRTRILRLWWEQSASRLKRWGNRLRQP